jgi:glycosyltransferase involved in cell wall biosynthesis
MAMRGAVSCQRVRVHVVDPAAFTPPYDHALCAALAGCPDRLDVTLVTARFAHGDVPAPRGYRVDERFYRGTERFGPAHPRARAGARLARHVPDMVAWRRAAAREADVAHLQWLSVQPIDVHLLPRKVPLVLTAHDVLPREPRRGQLEGQRRLYEHVDGVVVHSAHGRARLVDEVGVDPAKVEVIPHGVLDHLTTLAPVRPPELPEPERPVVLFFGLIRPYKGLDVLYEAWRALAPDAELWVVGQPRVEVPDAPPGARVVPRYVSDAEAAWCFAHADVVVLPYREIDQSGVLFTALAFGRPMILSDVGGFPEVDAAAHVPAGDAAALADALDRLLRDPGERQRLAAAAREAAATTYAWPAIAERHAALYGRLVGRS